LRCACPCVRPFVAQCQAQHNAINEPRYACTLIRYPPNLRLGSQCKVLATPRVVCRINYRWPPLVARLCVLRVRRYTPQARTASDSSRRRARGPIECWRRRRRRVGNSPKSQRLGAPPGRPHSGCGTGKPAPAGCNAGLHSLGGWLRKGARRPGSPWPPIWPDCRLPTAKPNRWIGQAGLRLTLAAYTAASGRL
jgi:hypothetical protein